MLGLELGLVSLVHPITKPNPSANPNLTHPTIPWTVMGL